MRSFHRTSTIAIAIALNGGPLSCSRPPQRFIEIPRPGGPPYWESSVPREDRAPDAGSEEQDDSGTGVSDLFLWDRKPPDLADAAPAAQIPVGGEPDKRGATPRENATDAGLRNGNDRNRYG